MTDSGTYELLSLLKVDNKGWNVALFENEMKISAAICAVCCNVCVEAVELGCEHNFNDIYLYCNQCLNELITTNDGKCPIDNHKDPEIVQNRSIQRQISRAKVICPYSAEVKLAAAKQTKKELEAITEPNDNKKHIMDTMQGLMNDVEAEGTHVPGIELQHQNIAVYQEQVYGNSQLKLRMSAPSTPTTAAQYGCDWKGTFNELVHKHLAECTEINNPTFTLNIKIEELQDENATLKQKIVFLETDVTKHKVKLTEKNAVISDLEDKNAQLNGQVMSLQEEITNDIFKDEVFQNETTDNGDLKVLNEQREFEKHKDVSLSKEYLHLTASVVCMKYPLIQHVTTEDLINRVKKYEFWEYHDKMVSIMEDELEKKKNVQKTEKSERKKKKKRKFHILPSSSK